MSYPRLFIATALLFTCATAVTVGNSFMQHISAQSSMQPLKPQEAAVPLPSTAKFDTALKYPPSFPAV